MSRINLDSHNQTVSNRNGGQKATKPEISVIVPCYNVESTVANSLGTIQDQTFTNFEVICINDGSTDDTLGCIEPFLIDKRFRVISQENKGLGGARNTGIQAAKGKYVTFIDSDDWILPTFLEKLIEEARDGDKDIVDALHLELDESGEITRQRENVDNGEQDYFHRIIVGKAPSNACARLFKRSFLEENNLFFLEQTKHEDLPFTHRAYASAKSHKTVPEALYIWNLNPTSISRTFTIYHAEHLIKCMKSEYDYFLRTDTPSFSLYYPRLLFYWRTILQRLKRVEDQEAKKQVSVYLQGILYNSPQVRPDHVCVRIGKRLFPRWSGENIALISRHIPEECKSYFEHFLPSKGQATPAQSTSAAAPQSAAAPHYSPEFSEENITFAYLFALLLYHCKVCNQYPATNVTFAALLLQFYRHLFINRKKAI